MSRAPFSLHCIVCFDAFNLTDRPPVILPCGHTFICLSCSKRLDSCMECRTPLYAKFPGTTSIGCVDNNNTRQQRYNYNRGEIVNDHDHNIGSFPPATPSSLSYDDMYNNNNNNFGGSGGYGGRYDGSSSPRKNNDSNNNSIITRRPTTPTSSMSWSSMRVSSSSQQQRSPGSSPTALSRSQRQLQRQYQFQQQQHQQHQQRRNIHHHQVVSPDGILLHTPVEPIQLPIPKNLVLMSIMEAGGRTSGASVFDDDDDDKNNKNSGKQENDENDNDNDDDDKTYESGDDDEQVMAGMKLLSSGGSYGTYVIREPNGLQIYDQLVAEEEKVEIEESKKHITTTTTTQQQQQQQQQQHEHENNGNTPTCTSEMSASNNPQKNDKGEEHKSCELLIRKSSDGCSTETVIKKEDSDENTLKKMMNRQENVDQVEPQCRNYDDNNNIIVREGRSDVEDKNTDRQEEEEQHCSEEAEEEEEEESLINNKNSKPSNQTQPIVHLETGQTIQVVHFKNGIAKLARGRGYVYASDTQIVKVGDPLDEACKIEGMLSSLSIEKQSLQRNLARISNAENKLSSALLDAKLTDEGDPFAFAPGAKLEQEQQQDAAAAAAAADGGGEDYDHPVPDDIQQPLLIKKCLSSASHSSGASNATAPNQNFPTATPDDYANLCHTTLESLARAANETVEEDDDVVLPHGIFCGDMLRSDLLGFSDSVSSEPSLLHIAAPKTTTRRKKQQTRGGASRADRRSRLDSDDRSHNSQSSSSQVDFRTGLSGHMSLASTRTNANHSLAVAGQRGSIRMMGEHKGASKIRKPQRGGGGVPPDLGNSVSW